MNTITLMRHGPPLLEDVGWIHARDMAQWIERYDRALVGQVRVPDHAMAAGASAQVIAASPLRRATSSVAALGLQADLIDACFAEAQLPHPGWRGLRLPPQLWAAMLRLSWRCGYKRAPPLRTLTPACAPLQLRSA